MNFIKFILIFNLMFFSLSSNSKSYRNNINIKDFESQMKRRDISDYLYSEKKVKNNEFFIREFFRDKRLDNEYTLFGKGVVDYVYYEIDGIKNYEYTESFIDCEGRYKISHRVTYNNIGKYLNSKLFLINFEDETLPINKITCEQGS